MATVEELTTPRVSMSFAIASIINPISLLQVLSETPG
jgi:hypothetical protein